MKRAFLLLLCAALLLTACGREVSAGETTAPEPDETQYRAQGTPTADGVLVHTDPSAYRAQDGARAQYTRLREGPLTEFEPSADYGAVYPYTASWLFYSDPEGYSGKMGACYGFVDRQGRILTDGVYIEISDDAYDENNGEWFGVPFWIAHRVVASEEPLAVYDNYWDYWDGAFDEYYVIAKDGSFAVGPYFKVQGLSRGFAVWDYDAKLTVFDENAQVLFTGDKLLEQGIRDCSDLQYSEGLYTLRYYPEGKEKYMNYQACFCDEAGNLVLGPYRTAAPFQEGLAAVSEDEEFFEYIDHDGQRVIGPLEGYCESFREGLAIVGGSRLIDKSGNLILQTEDLETSRFGRTDYGFIWETWSYDGSAPGTYSAYDKTGKLLCSGEGNFTSILDETTFIQEAEEGCRLVRSSGEERFLPELYRLQPWLCKLDGKPVSGYLGFSSVDKTPWFVPGDLSEPIHCVELPEGEILREPWGEKSWRSEFSCRDESSGERWYFLWDGKLWRGLSDTGAELSLPDGLDYLHLSDGLFRATMEDAAWMFDADGNTIFRYPLDAGD